MCKARRNEKNCRHSEKLEIKISATKFPRGQLKYVMGGTTPDQAPEPPPPPPPN